MADCFDKIDKAANNYARDTNDNVYRPLLDGLKSKDPVTAIAFLKFINTMIYKADDEMKQAKFIAKLETQHVFKLLETWSSTTNEDILE